MLAGWLLLLVASAEDFLMAKYREQYLSNRQTPEENWRSLKDASFVSPSVLPSRIVVIPDLHGDFDYTVNLLKLTGLIDDEGKWTGGNETMLVQLGDIADRGPHAPIIYELLWDLQDSASPGQVVLLTGNHEIMMMLGDYAFLSRRETDLYHGGLSPKNVWNPKTGYLGRNVVLRHKPIFQFEDLIFVHGGLESELSLIDDVQISNLVFSAVNEGKHHEIVAGDTSPLWSRLYTKRDPKACRDLQKALERRQATHQIVGHTVTTTNTIQLLCNNEFIMTDTGVSAWMLNRPTALIIEYEDNLVRNWYSIQPKIGKTKLFSDKVCLSENNTRGICKHFPKSEF